MAHCPLFRVRVPVAPVKAAPEPDATCTSECLYGEEVTQLDSHEEWSHIRMHRDNYEGFVHNSALEKQTDNGHAATHSVHTRSTLLFTQPSLKSPVVSHLPFQARLHLNPCDNAQFFKTDRDEYVWSEHTHPLDTKHSLNPIELARRHFLGTPYLWGGCSTAGLDCSGLVQALALSQNIALPRDSVDQEQAIPTIIEYEKRRPSDILYWPGHTAILISTNKLLHATAHSLSCQEESLDDVLERAGPVSSVRRIFEL